MIEGWHNEDYFILFENSNEAAQMSVSYALGHFLSDYTLVGLKSWDDFILINRNNQFFTVPTVPLDPKYVHPFNLNVDPSNLRADQRFVGKIRWFVKPLIFGGDARDESNTAWITADEHVKVVNWWNELYCDLQKK